MTRCQAGSHQRRLAAAHRHHGPATSATKNDPFLLHQPHGQLASCALTAHQRLLAPTSSPRLRWAPLRPRHADSSQQSTRQRRGCPAGRRAPPDRPAHAAPAAGAASWARCAAMSAADRAASQPRRFEPRPKGARTLALNGLLPGKQSRQRCVEQCQCSSADKSRQQEADTPLTAAAEDLWCSAASSDIARLSDR